MKYIIVENVSIALFRVTTGWLLIFLPYIHPNIHRFSLFYTKKKIVRILCTHAFTRASPWTPWAPQTPSCNRFGFIKNRCAHIFSVLSPGNKKVDSNHLLNYKRTSFSASQICKKRFLKILNRWTKSDFSKFLSDVMVVPQIRKISAGFLKKLRLIT